MTFCLTPESRRFMKRLFKREKNVFVGTLEEVTPGRGSNDRRALIVIRDSESQTAVHARVRLIEVVIVEPADPGEEAQ